MALLAPRLASCRGRSAAIVDAVTAPAKAALRARFLAARKAVPHPVRTREADAVRTALLNWVRGQANTVCAYVPVGTEPGSARLLDELYAAGVRVLLPVAISAGSDRAALPLRWARYVPGELAKADFGLLEPTGDRLPAEALSEAQVVIVPALAVDRRGARLGRGAGFYDRSLPLRGADAALIAIVRDDEFVDELPAEPHDVPMTHVLTPSGGVRRL